MANTITPEWLKANDAALRQAFAEVGLLPQEDRARMPPTLTGRENAPPPAPPPASWSDKLQSLGWGALLGPFAPAAPRPGVGEAPSTVQTLTGRQIQDTGLYRTSGIADPESAAVGETLGLMGPAGAAMNRFGSAIVNSPPAQWLGRTLARPGIGIPTATAGATFATTAQTQPPSPNAPHAEQDAQATLDKLFANQRALQAQADTIRTELSRFKTLKDTDAAGVRDLQNYLQLNDFNPGAFDGKMGKSTRAALQAFLGDRRQQLERLGTQLQGYEGENGAIAKAQAAVAAGRDADAVAFGNARMAEVGQPTWMETYGNVAGLTAGGLVGAGESALGSMAVRALERRAARRAGALVSEMGTGTPNERAARVNQFWSEGESRVPPFAYVPNNRPYPFTANPDFQPGFPGARNASEIYPSPIVTPPAVAPPLAFGLKGGVESTISVSQLDDAHQDLARAQEALRQRPNDEARIQALIAARNKVATLEAAIRFGIGEGLGATFETAVSRFVHRTPRPDVGRAEAERGDVDLLLNPPPPNPPPPPPLQPGVTRYRNPATGEERYLDAHGRWRGPRPGGGQGWTDPPPATWDRTSWLDLMFSGYPTAA
jgi:hypothetical protein